MIASRVRARSGITLTEILISILIMGIGLISLATLFPLGLIRLRDAARFQRGGMLAQSATDDMDARALLLKPTFTQTWYGAVDPFTVDSTFGGFNSPVKTLGLSPTGTPLVSQPGLVVCYDPLWRAVTNVVPNTNLADPHLAYNLNNTPPYTLVAEARFGAGLVVPAGGGVINAFNLRTTAPGDGGIPSAYGLQRISNFIPWSNTNYTALYPFTYHNNFLAGSQAPDVAGDTFTSIDDIVFNSAEAAASTGHSPLLPDLSLNPSAIGTVNDWKYSWLFTGRQVDSTNGTMFQGDVVVCDSRQFAFNAVGTNAVTAVGETVVEAIFGYSTQASNGYSVGADRTVLIRWPTTVPDPSVRVGGWIADVTYERDLATSLAKVKAGQTTSVNGAPFQRCNWYQVVKRTDAQPDPDFSPDPANNNNYYRRMILTISSPVKSKTLLAAGGAPVFVNAALIMPSVIYVYPRAFTVPQATSVY